MRFLYFVIICLCSTFSLRSQVENSSFSQGDWYKIPVAQTGVYKIDKNFLTSIGLNPNQIDPNTFQLFGHGGQSLDLVADTAIANDPPEVSVFPVGFEDGRFDDQDYLLFFAQASQGYQTQNDSFLNPYQDTTYYYLTHSQQNAQQVTTFDIPTAAPTDTYTTYNARTFYEEDNYNIAAQGRRWFSERFDTANPTKTYDFQLAPLAENTTIEVKLSFAMVHTSTPQVIVRLLSEGQFVNSGSVTGITSYDTDLNAYNPNRQAYTLTLNSGQLTNNSLSVQVDYRTGVDLSSELYLDYIDIAAVHNLSFDGAQLIFANDATAFNSGVGNYQIDNARAITSIWDISDVNAIKVQTFENQETLNVAFEQGSLKKMIAVGNRFLTPDANAVTRFANQDLKGTILADASGAFQDLDYLIIAPAEFANAASQLVNFRSTNDGLAAKWVSTQRIYNEFSSGKQDVAAIRNFVRYVYQNASSEDRRLKYVSIMGDGSYDYKDRLTNNTNFVPLYHTQESGSLTKAFATDDYYVMVDDQEGAFSDTDDMDLAIGRILCRTDEEGVAMVSKIKSYAQEASFADWRTNLLFVSDDVDDVTEGDDSLQEKIIEIADLTQQKAPRANIRKLLIDAFEQVNVSGGERYPEARNLLESYFNQGMAFINYFGHGNEDGITSEYIFNSESAQSLNNIHYPVFVTLTCELTKFDNPDRITAGEYLFWNRNGGAVALVTTTRLLFLSVGERLNDDFAEAMFDAEGNLRTIGEAVRLVKNQNTGANARTVFCIGDPYIKPLLPQADVQLTHINQQPIATWSANNESLKALERVTLQGNVLAATGEVQTDFNGEATVVLFGKNIESTTLGNDGETQSQVLVTLNFSELGNTVFRGKASVVNGNFTIEFILPKNIDLDLGEGRISVYAINAQKTQDVAGATSVQVGGVNENAEADDTPPSIELFLNDTYFYSGQVVGNTPSIYAKIADDSGINTSGGVGHDIIAILDGDEANPIVLNTFYTADLDDFTKGTLNYKLAELEAGEHSLALRVSDTHNNVASQEISFTVNTDTDFEITNVLNYPNPCVSYTEFWFSHTSIAADVLEVSLQLMTVSGKVIAQQFATLSGANSYTGELTWNVRDDFGNRLAKGVYLYKITVKSTILNQTSSKIQKLVVL